jgi:hypothetical protein
MAGMGLRYVSATAGRVPSKMAPYDGPALALGEAVRLSHSVGGAATMGHLGPFENGPQGSSARTLAEKGRNPSKLSKHRVLQRGIPHWSGRERPRRRDET